MSVQTTQIIPNYSVVEMVTYLYGDLNLITEFMLSNMDIGVYGVDADLNLFTGTTVKYDPSLSDFIPAPLSFKTPDAYIKTSTVTGQPTMSTFDLTLQAYGSLDLLSKFMLDNNIDGVADKNLNRKLTYQLSLVTSNQMNKYNAYNNILYATLWTQTLLPGYLEQEVALGVGGPYVLLENNGHIVLESYN